MLNEIGPKLFQKVSVLSATQLFTFGMYLLNGLKQVFCKNLCQEDCGGTRNKRKTFQDDVSQVLIVQVCMGMRADWN